MATRPSSSPSLPRIVPAPAPVAPSNTARRVAATAAEEACIERAREGDRAAWEELYAAHYDVVLRRIRFLCGQLPLAEELTQEAFMQAMIKIDKFDGRASFRAWLRAVALNIVRNHWRSQRSRAKAHAKLEVVLNLTGSKGELADARLLQRRRSDALYAAVAQLPDRLREVFVLRDLEGLGREQVAEELGITANNVSVRGNRARQRLREILREMGHGLSDDGGRS